MDNSLETTRMTAINSGSADAARAAHYDPQPEQIGRITKALAHLAASGVDIGPEGAMQVTRVQAVKDRFPKTPITAKSGGV